MKKEIKCYIQDQTEIELPENAVPGFVALVLVNNKEYDSMYCRSEEEAQRMCEEIVRDYQIRQAWSKKL